MRLRSAVAGAAVLLAAAACGSGAQDDTGPDAPAGTHVCELLRADEVRTALGAADVTLTEEPGPLEEDWSFDNCRITVDEAGTDPTYELLLRVSLDRAELADHEAMAADWGTIEVPGLGTAADLFTPTWLQVLAGDRLVRLSGRYHLPEIPVLSEVVRPVLSRLGGYRPAPAEVALPACDAVTPQAETLLGGEADRRRDRADDRLLCSWSRGGDVIQAHTTLGDRSVLEGAADATEDESLDLGGAPARYLSHEDAFGTVQFVVDGWRLGGYVQHQPHDHGTDHDPLIALARAFAAELPEAAPEPPVAYPVDRNRLPDRATAGICELIGADEAGEILGGEVELVERPGPVDVQTFDGCDLVLGGGPSAAGSTVRIDVSAQPMTLADHELLYRQAVAPAGPPPGAEVPGLGEDARFVSDGSLQVFEDGRVLRLRDLPGHDEAIALAELVLPRLPDLPEPPEVVALPECDALTDSAAAVLGERPELRRDNVSFYGLVCGWATETGSLSARTTSGEVAGLVWTMDAPGAEVLDLAGGTENAVYFEVIGSTPPTAGVDVVVVPQELGLAVEHRPHDPERDRDALVAFADELATLLPEIAPDCPQPGSDCVRRP
ncbi:hypothetical protein [Jiangella mangrovi]|uniref:DUF3558 domain-containing protein n=1 Tax=Jiangella mangrovi TaxID=1524084 RepID=A0A7W9GNY6_9ACTN|nr:hypothetical protein [Jiangella mangrovi]MBB5787096.1 hypothetical protein [Jiangella mangrovi]